MPYPNFHAARIQDPDIFPKKRYEKDAFGNGIDVIWGITDAGKAEVQAIRFDKNVFTPEQARAWLKKHPEHKPISFEQATATAKTQKVESDPLTQFQRTLWDLAQDAPGYAHVHYCPSCRLNKVEGHDAILQGLDRKVGNLFFGKAPFAPTVDEWNARPIIFSKIHPDPLKFNQDPEAELTRVNGAITGELSDAALETIGRARLMVRKNYTDDTAFRMYDEGRISVDTLNRSLEAIPKSLQLIAEGKLSHSSAFICPDDGESLYGIVKPNHVLDFEETPKDQPVDPMAVILNKQETENVTENAQLQIGRVISSKNESKLRAAMDALMKFVDGILTKGGEEPAPVEPQISKEPVMKDNDPEQSESQSQNKEQKMGEITAELIKPVEDPKVKELTDQMAKLQKELDDTKAALKTHEDAKVQAQKEKFDADWLALEKSVIPPGEVKDPADKTKLQKMSVEDPLAFAAKIASWKKAPAMGAEGTSHTQGPGGEDPETERNRILSQKQAIPGTLH